MPKKERVMFRRRINATLFKLAYEHRIKDIIPLKMIQHMHIIYGFKGSFEPSKISSYFSTKTILHTIKTSH